MKTAYLLSGGSYNIDFIRDILKNKKDDDIIIAIDTGLTICDILEIIPECLIGDFDSISADILKHFIQDKRIEIYEHNPIKDYSDTELAIDICVQKGISAIYLLAALGKRMDHGLANIFTLCSYRKKGIDIYILDEYNKIYARDESFVIFKQEMYGKYLSLYPMGKPAYISIKGVKYPLDNFLLNKYETPSLSISNEVIEEEASILFSDSMILVIESRDTF